MSNSGDVMRLEKRVKLAILETILSLAIGFVDSNAGDSLTVGGFLNVRETQPRQSQRSFNGQVSGNSHKFRVCPLLVHLRQKSPKND
ncbi:MAG: hypothetical protein F6K45_21520 [Kamptonema sp. SIO1D9]|nr:hypothetical protein [Kamptonema sp. SIO1D9]